MVANKAGRGRRFDSYPTDAAAKDAAERLARQISTQYTNAALMTKRASGRMGSCNAKNLPGRSIAN